MIAGRLMVIVGRGPDTGFIGTAAAAGLYASLAGGADLTRGSSMRGFFRGPVSQDFARGSSDGRGWAVDAVCRPPYQTTRQR